jgi:hypothetical protein
MLAKAHGKVESHAGTVATHDVRSKVAPAALVTNKILVSLSFEANENQKSGRLQSQHKVPICGACMTAGIENGKVFPLHNGGSIDFGPIKAAFGPNVNKHSSNMAEAIWLRTSAKHTTI